MKVFKRVRWRVVCCGWRKNEGSGRNRSKNDGSGGTRRREGVEDEVSVLFDEVPMVKYVMKLPAETSQSGLCARARAREQGSNNRTQRKIRIRLRDSETY